MSKTEASPTVTLGTREKRIAKILHRFLDEVKEPMETISFLSRIVEEKAETPLRLRCPNCYRTFDPTCNEEGHSIEGEIAIDPNGSYRCDLCNNWTRGREGKLLNSGTFVCNWCRHAEMEFDVIPKEGDNVID